VVLELSDNLVGLPQEVRKLAIYGGGHAYKDYLNYLRIQGGAPVAGETALPGAAAWNPLKSFR
jgi:hypothetical protein